jgi:hypothetical protein
LLNCFFSNEVIILVGNINKGVEPNVACLQYKLAVLVIVEVVGLHVMLPIVLFMKLIQLYRHSAFLLPNVIIIKFVKRVPFALTERLLVAKLNILLLQFNSLQLLLFAVQLVLQPFDFALQLIYFKHLHFSFSFK